MILSPACSPKELIYSHLSKRDLQRRYTGRYTGIIRDITGFYLVEIVPGGEKKKKNEVENYCAEFFLLIVVIFMRKHLHLDTRVQIRSDDDDDGLRGEGKRPYACISISVYERLL